MNLEFNCSSLKEQFVQSSMVFTLLLMQYNTQGQKIDAESKTLAEFLR